MSIRHNDKLRVISIFTSSNAFAWVSQDPLSLLLVGIACMAMDHGHCAVLLVTVLCPVIQRSLCVVL